MYFIKVHGSFSYQFMDMLYFKAWFSTYRARLAKINLLLKQICIIDKLKFILDDCLQFLYMRIDNIVTFQNIR